MTRIFRFLLLLTPYLLLAAAGAAYWYRETYFSEIFSAWLPLALCISVLLTGYLLCTLRYMAVLAAFAAAGIIGVWFVEISESPFFTPPISKDAPRHAMIAQWNPRHDIGVMNWLRHLPAEIDLVVLSEVGPAISAQMGGAAAMFPFKLADAEARTIILSRQPLLNPTPIALPGTTSPMLRVETTLSGKRIRLFALTTTEPNDAAAWEQRDLELSRAAQAIAGSPYPTLLVGSLNVTPYATIFSKLLKISGLSAQTATYAMPGSWPSYALVPPLQITTDHVLVGEGIKIQTRGRSMPCCSSHVALYTRIGF